MLRRRKKRCPYWISRIQNTFQLLSKESSRSPKAMSSFFRFLLFDVRTSHRFSLLAGFLQRATLLLRFGGALRKSHLFQAWDCRYRILQKIKTLNSALIFSSNEKRIFNKTLYVHPRSSNTVPCCSRCFPWFLYPKD